MFEIHRKCFVALLAILLAGFVLPSSIGAQGGVLFVEQDNVGIGTALPQLPLHITRPSGSPPPMIRLEQAGPSRLEFRDTANSVNWDFRTTSGDAFVITKLGTGTNELLVNSAGDLVVPGSIIAQGGDGSQGPGDQFPDFVFEPDYPLMDLDELADFIGREKHLPNVFSADDIRQRGHINMSELQLQLLRKVEELTLYTLQQEQEIRSLRNRLEGLEN